MSSAPKANRTKHGWEEKYLQGPSAHRHKDRIGKKHLSIWVTPAQHEKIAGHARLSGESLDAFVLRIVMEHIIERCGRAG